MNNTKHNPWAECDKLRAENERLTRELEAARKVAEAAVEWDLHEGGENKALSFIVVRDLETAVREYLAAATPLESRIDAACDNLDAKAGAAVGVYRMGEDIEC